MSLSELSDYGGHVANGGVLPIAVRVEVGVGVVGRLARKVK